MKRALKILLVACLLAQMLLPAGAIAAGRFNISNLVELANALNGSVQLSPEKEAEYNLTGGAQLSIADLALMAKEIANPSQPSELIGEQRAKEIALGEVPGATEANVVRCRLDFDDGVQIYEVVINYQNIDYEYEINAVTGEIVAWSMEKPVSPGQIGDIGEEAAKQIVLERIPGATSAHFTDFGRDYENGSLVYEGELRYDGMEYDFEVTASNGEIVKWSAEPYTDGPRPTTTPDQTPRPTFSPTPTAVPSELIGDSRAKEIALAQAEGATASDIRKCELDWDDGVRVYEVEIRVGATEYDFDINAYTGDIRSSSMKKPAPTGASGDIGAERARQIVLERIPGATAANFTEFETGREDGVPVYEGEVVYDGAKYDFEIVAATGEVIEWSMDKIFDSGLLPSATPGVTHLPSASASGLIGADRAKEIALSNVHGATEANIRQCKLDRENGIQVYEVEIWFDGAEYEYNVNAVNGVIESSKMDRPVPHPVPSGDIGEQQAKQVVLGLIPGATSSDILSFRADREDGARIYEGTARYGGTRYEFEILAATGELLEWKTQRVSASPAPVASPATPRPSAAPTAPAQSGIISMDEAQRIALERVPGATAANVVKCQLDRDDGRQIYEIEIRYENWEYDIEIDARTGVVLDFDKEWDD